jgi:nuclear factor I
MCLTGLTSQHGSVTSMSSGGGGTGATASYYQQTSAPSQHADQQSHSQHSPTKYPENGHDTLSDFVHFVCQEAETQETQVRGVVHRQGCRPHDRFKEENILSLRGNQKP